MNEGKWCPRCERQLSVGCFTVNRAKADGLQPYCRECMKAYRREHYSNNKEAHYDRNKKTEQRLRELIWTIKASSLCVDCGGCFNPWQLEFDHRDPSQKDMNISQLIKYGSEKRLMAEIAKCDLVCANCHRDRTAEYFGWKGPENFMVD